jgi:hypothetical protein
MTWTIAVTVISFLAILVIISWKLESLGDKLDKIRADNQQFHRDLRARFRIGSENYRKERTV